MNKALVTILDILVPFGLLLRASDGLKPFERWWEVLLRFIPGTFFGYWLFSLIPPVGGFIYMLCLVPLSARLHWAAMGQLSWQSRAETLLVYFTVILIGFGGIWSFVGHTFMADFVATSIGWEIGSPFQTELAFYTLGTSVAALLAVWIRGHLITAVVLSKSVFWYGAAYVHIQDALVNQNYAASNIGTPLVGDLIYPTLLLYLLFKTTRFTQDT